MVVLEIIIAGPDPAIAESTAVCAGIPRPGADQTVIPGSFSPCSFAQSTAI